MMISIAIAIFFVGLWLAAIWGAPVNGNRKENDGYCFEPEEGFYLLQDFRQGKRRPYQLTEPHWFHTPVSSSVLPEGFCLDFASIPFWVRPFIFLLDPWRRYERSAGHHDGDYQFQYLYRFAADAKFRVGMFVDGTPWLCRQVLYFAVRVFGRSSWNKNKPSVNALRERYGTDHCLYQKRHARRRQSGFWKGAKL